MTTAFALSGCGSLGAVQVGMLLARAEHEITPDLVVGTSTSAVNAAWNAGRPGLNGAAELAEVFSRRNREAGVLNYVAVAGVIGRKTVGS